MRAVAPKINKLTNKPETVITNAKVFLDVLLCSFTQIYELF